MIYIYILIIGLIYPLQVLLQNHCPLLSKGLRIPPGDHRPIATDRCEGEMGRVDLPDVAQPWSVGPIMVDVSPKRI